MVHDYDERGMLGIATDPAFPASPYIYVYYTKDGAVRRNRVSRFTMLGDFISRDSEVVLLELDPLSSAGNHNGGGMTFGAGI